MHRKEFIILSVLALLAGSAGGWYLGHDKSPPIPIISSSPTASASATPTVTPAIEKSAKSYTDLVSQADAQRKNGGFEAAVRVYDRAIALDGKRTEAYLGRGQAYLALAEGSKATEDFGTANSLSPNDPEAQTLLIAALSIQGKFDEAMRKTSEVSGPGAAYYHAVLQCSTGAFDTCRSEATALVKSDPPQDIKQKAQRVVEAFKQFDLFSDGEDAHRRTLVAEAMADNGDYALSERLLGNVVANAKDYRDAWILLGYARYNLHKYDAALDALQRAQGLDQKKPETAYYTGLCYVKKGMREQAIDYLRRALDYGSTARLDIQKYLADTYVDIGDYDSALTYYLAIVNEGKSHDITAFIRPMWVYIEVKKQPEKALALAQQAVQKYPNTAMASNLLGWAQLAYGDLSNAEKNLMDALSHDPNLQAAYLNLGDLRTQQGRLVEAKKAYHLSYDIDPDSSIGTLAGTKYNALP